MFTFVSASGGSTPIAPTKLGKLFGLEITDTMLSGFLTVLILILFAVVIRIFFVPRWRKNLRNPGVLQSFLEWTVSLVKANSEETLGHNAGFGSMWFFAVMAYIFVGTLIEVSGLRPPTSDLNLTLALGLSTFVLIQAFGIKEKKLRRLDRYAPRIAGVIPIPNPINIITDGIVPFSMALRMFGSVFSGYLIMHLLYGVFPIAAPAVGTLMFTVFHAVVQSYIFMMLSLNFISEATE